MLVESSVIFSNFGAENLKIIISENKIASIYNGVIINSEFIDKLKLNESIESKLPFNNKLKRKGKITKGKLEFKTSELSNRANLIKIKTNRNIFYLLANLFGGCNRTVVIILDKQQILK